MQLVTLPEETAIGDIIAYSNYRLTTPDGKRIRLTFYGAEYFKRMKERGLYSTDNEEIGNRIEILGLTDLYNKRIL